MKIYNLKAAPVANVTELEDERGRASNPLGSCTHLRGYQWVQGRSRCRGAVELSGGAFLLFVVKQLERAERVVVVYEAGPLALAVSELKELSVECYVCAPDSSEQQKKRRKNTKSMPAT